MIRRRDVITLLGGAAAWPVTARAQQAGTVRRIGVLTFYAESDRNGQAKVAALARGLRDLGWTDGGNLRIAYRWGSEGDSIRTHAAELVAANPDVIVTDYTPTAQELQRLTRTIPIVFMNIGDPIETGVVTSLARPGGNTTGFMNMEPSIGGKWLEVLTEIAPGLSRVLVIVSFGNAAQAARLRMIEASALTFGVQVLSSAVRDASEIESAIYAAAREGKAGLIVMPGGPPVDHRKMIFALAARYRLPAIYAYRYFVSEGGLVSFGPDDLDMYLGAASYVDRILKGERPGDLPVQGPTKFDLAINVTTAKALGLTVPLTLLTRADEVIE
jgi:putative tryptophan/tyrosine transport system substrate-binding protein